MVKKILFFFLFNSSLVNFFSQNLIIIEGSVLSPEGNSKIFGARIYLTQNGNLITKSISNQNGEFFIKSPISSKGKFDLLISRKGYLDYKILLDLTTIDFMLNKSISLELVNNNIVILSADTKNSAFDYSEKYVWSQTEFILKVDEAYRNQIAQAIKESNNTTSDIIVKTDSATIKARDEKIIKDVNLIFVKVKSLIKDKNYKAAFDKNTEAELLLTSLSNPIIKSDFLSKIETSKKSISVEINSEDQVFNSQLKKANDNFALGRKGYAKAKSILLTDPMKSRANDPKYIDLIGKIDKMVSYYSMKDAAYKLVKTNKNKKNQESIVELKKTLKEAESCITFMPPKEFPQLKKSIDSLQLVLDPNFIIVKTPVVIPATTQNQGIILLAPGEIYTGIRSDAYEDLLAVEQYNKNELIVTIDKVKDYLEYEAYYNNILAESISQDYQFEIQRKKDEIEKINISKKNANDDLQLQIQIAKITSDSIINIQNLEVKSNNLITDSLIRKSRNEIEYAKFQKELTEKLESEGIVKIVQEMAIDPTPAETTPNNLKNEAGVLYEKSKMTEEIFKIKNTEGFVSSIICRRIVVDENGYGIVYERTTNEIGKSYYTRNGFSITETIWFNESTGINVIKK
jgi:hypothetical protein